MDIRLVATDLDGTLLGGTNGRYGFRPEGVAALRAAVANGVQVAIVTGRDPAFIMKLLAKEDIDFAREGWPQILLPEERHIFYLRNGRYEPDAAWNQKVMAAETACFAQIRSGVEQLLAGVLCSIDATVHRPDLAVEEQRGFMEVIFKDAQASRKGERVLMQWLQEQELPYYTVRNVAGVAIRHTTVGKGQVLAQLVHELGIAPEQVLAMGDSANDLSMLDGRFGFRSAVPGNAEIEVQEAVRRCGGYVAQRQYADGIAEALSYLQEAEPA